MKTILLLIDERPSQKPMLKFLGNSIVGAMHSQREKFRSDKVWREVLQGFYDDFTGCLPKDKLRQRSLIYGNTDSLAVPTKMHLNFKPLLEKGYRIRMKFRFKWLYVYNAQKWIGATDKGEIEAHGFPRLGPSKPPIIDQYRGFLFERLKKAKSKPDRMRILRHPESVARQLKPPSPKENPKLYTVRVNKRGNECYSTNLLEIWDRIPIGISSFVFSKTEVTPMINEMVSTFKP